MLAAKSRSILRVSVVIRREGIIARLRRLLPGGGSKRGVAILASGTAVGSLVLALFLPMISRLYGVEALGTYGVYTAVLSLVLVVATLMYELSVPLPESDQDAANLLGLCIVIAGVTSLLSALAMRALEEHVPMVRGHGLAWILPCAIGVAGTYQALNYWGSRRHRYPLLATTRVIQRTGQVSATLAFAVVPPSPIGLPAGDLIGRAVATLVLAGGILRNDIGRLRGITPRHMLDVAGRYKRFPIYVTGANLANKGRGQLPFILLAAMYGAKVTGYYVVAEAVVAIPIVIGATAISQVYLPKASLARGDGIEQLRSLYLRTARRLVMASGILMVIFLVPVPIVFSVVFGAEWKEAGRYAQVMALMYMPGFFLAPLSNTLIVLGRQHIQLAFEFGVLVTAVAALTGAKVLGLGGYGAVLLLSTTVGLESFLYLFIPPWVMGRVEAQAGRRFTLSSTEAEWDRAQGC